MFISQTLSAARLSFGQNVETQYFASLQRPFALRPTITCGLPLSLLNNSVIQNRGVEYLTIQTMICQIKYIKIF